MKAYLPRIIGKAINLMALVNSEKAALKALDIFSTPRKGRLADHHATYLSDFAQDYVDTTVGKISTYTKRGKGERILLCHGWESNSFRWRKLIRYFDQHGLNYELIMMDAPAHGQSEGDRFTAIKYAEAMRDVYQHYKPDYMIGHSVGGFAMTKYLHDYQPSLKKVIVMASPDSLELISDNYFNLLGLNRRVRRAYEQLIERKYHYPTSYFNASTFINKVSIPGILIHDVEDDINPYFEGESIISKWDQGELITTKGYGHSLQAEEVFIAIKDYLSATH